MKNLPNKLDLTKYKNLKKSLRDHLSASIEEYKTTKEDKTQGLASGFIGRDADQSAYMLKSGELEHVEVDFHNGSPFINKRDLMQEYICSDLYKRILYDRAPTIGLAKTSHSKEKEEKGKLFIKSKFIEGFKTLNSVKDPFITILSNIDSYIPKESEIALEIDLDSKKIYWKTKDHKKAIVKDITPSMLFKIQSSIESSLNENIQKGEIKVGRKTYFMNMVTAKALRDSDPEIDQYMTNLTQNIEGFEKVLAACLFMGEEDFHGENLGVVENKVVKIDHGRSAMNLFVDEIALRKKLTKSISELYYEDMNLNPTILKQYIDEISSISSEELSQLIGSRIDNLKKEKFKLEDRVSYYQGQKIITRNINDYNDLENFYIEKLTHQQEVMRSFGETLSIISQIEYSDDSKTQTQWINGKWLKDINSGDPILWAIDNNKKISGDDPILWAVNNNKKISRDDPIMWAVIQERKIENQSPLVWAKNHDKQINSLSPIDFAKQTIERYGENNPDIELNIKNQLKQIQKDLGIKIRNLGIKRFIESNSKDQREILIKEQEEIEKIINPKKKDFSTKFTKSDNNSIRNI